MDPSILENDREETIRAIESAPDPESLEALRVAALGRKGRIHEWTEALKTAPRDRKPGLGRALNAFKTGVQAAVDRRRAQLESTRGRREALDLSLPGLWRGLGTRHPVHALIERASAIFRSLGFRLADGPDIEDGFHNFDALNTPEDHPSRDPGDTFYLGDGRLLRCHTSPVQVRYMLRHPPPVRIIAPGRCYRRDTADATHSANFHQIEGLFVDREVSLADLKGDLSFFARELLGPGVRTRFRPHHFPFTEPSVEVDFSCHVCGGPGCRVCKQSGWIEIAGAGLVHPRVFEAVGYDPAETMGYAFGIGVERLAMILHGIPDIRWLYENDLRILSQVRD